MTANKKIHKKLLICSWLIALIGLVGTLYMKFVISFFCLMNAIEEPEFEGVCGTESFFLQISYIVFFIYPILLLIVSFYCYKDRLTLTLLWFSNIKFILTGLVPFLLLDFFFNYETIGYVYYVIDITTIYLLSAFCVFFFFKRLRSKTQS